MHSGLSSTSSGMEELASSSPFLAILEEIENISVDLLADKEKKKRVKKKTESSTASWTHAWAVALGGVDSTEKLALIFVTKKVPPKICKTRPKPAYGRQGLDWIVGPGYSFVVWKPQNLLENPWKPTKNHEKQWN